MIITDGSGTCYIEGNIVSSTMSISLFCLIRRIKLFEGLASETVFRCVCLIGDTAKDDYVIIAEWFVLVAPPPLEVSL